MSIATINSVTEKIVSKCVLGNTKVNPAGGKSIPINHVTTGKPILVQLPVLKTWGVGKTAYDEKVKYNLGIAFPMSATAESSAVIANLAEFDDFIRTLAIEKCKDWFGLPRLTRDTVDVMFSPSLKYAKTESGEVNTTKPPSFNLKIPYYQGKVDTDVFMHDKTHIFPNGETSIEDVIMKGTYVTTLIQCAGIWFVDKRFGVSWTLLQTGIQPMSRPPRGQFLMMSEMAAALPVANSVVAPRHTEMAAEAEKVDESTAVADSDEEVDQAAAGAPKKGAKKITKKAP